MGGASVKLFLPVFKMNFPELVDLALPAEGVFHNLVFVSIKKTYPMQAYKIMHGLWGMGQMMFTKYLVVVDDDVDVHNTSEVLFRLCANTDPQRDSLFTKGPSDVLDHATTSVGSGSKLGIDATRKLPGEGFPRLWPPLIQMDDAVKQKINGLSIADERHRTWAHRRARAATARPKAAPIVSRVASAQSRLDCRARASGPVRQAGNRR
jgi:4-hydroxy-3-polyprenylbenzoate decarboxylase